LPRSMPILLNCFMDGPSLVALQRPRFGTLMPSVGAVHIIKGL
jgi:hypothetical protein